MMSKSRNRSKDQWIRYKKFEEENKRLKKEVSKLRKLVNSTVLDQLEEREQRVKEGKTPRIPTCEHCGNEDLKTVEMTRLDGQFEITICNSCNYRSELKEKKQAAN